jgi:cytochrome c oxidase assembly factor CtaG
VKLGRATAAFSTLALAAPAAAAAHGNAVPVSRLSSAWEAQPVVLALAGLMLLLFAQAFWRLRRRGRADHAPWTRVPLFVLAVAIGTLPLLSPLDAVGDDYLLSAHMLQHVLIGDVAPALALVALRGPLVLFFLPPFVLGPLARSTPVRRTFGFLIRPRVSLALWVLTIGLWHIPAAYDYTLTHQTVHDLEHLSFVIAGTLVWAQLIDPARRGALTAAQRLGYAGLLFAFGTILADVMIFSFHSLYPSYAARDERLWGLSAVRDQQLAGIVMMVEQLLVLGVFVALTLRSYVRERARSAPAGAAEART